MLCERGNKRNGWEQWATMGLRRRPPQSPTTRWTPASPTPKSQNTAAPASPTQSKSQNTTAPASPTRVLVSTHALVIAIVVVFTALVVALQSHFGGSASRESPHSDDKHSIVGGRGRDGGVIRGGSIGSSNLRVLGEAQTVHTKQEQKQKHHKVAASPAAAGDTESRIAWTYESRFPDFGTPDFFKYCLWTNFTKLSSGKEANDACTLLVRPDPNGTEGLALWVSNVVMAYFVALQRPECRLYIDYGPEVDLGSVITPVALSEYAEMNGLKDYAIPWNVPPQGFECRQEKGCQHLWTEPSRLAYTYSSLSSTITRANGERTLAAVPFYRFAYNPRYGKLKAEDFDELERNLSWMNGSFLLDTAFACAFSSLFRYSPPPTEQYEGLNDERALVISIYVRTGESEGKLVSKEAQVGYLPPAGDSLIETAREPVECALKQEQLYLTSNGDLSLTRDGAARSTFDKVIWTVLTDSQRVKQHIQETYGKKKITLGGESNSSGRVVTRNVITTASRGVHTRPKGRMTSDNHFNNFDIHQTAAFREGFLDWSLLGQSDIVIASREFSFGLTAAQSTARPIYHRVMNHNADGAFVNNACGRGVLVTRNSY